MRRPLPILSRKQYAARTDLGFTPADVGSPKQRAPQRRDYATASALPADPVHPGLLLRRPATDSGSAPCSA